MIKIIHIAKPVAGVGNYIHLISKHMDSGKFKNLLMCNLEDNIFEIKDSNGFPVEIFSVNLEREINLVNDFKCLLNIIKHLKKIKPDLIHCHSAKAGILGRLAGFFLNIPTYYTPHAYSYLSAETKNRKFFLQKIEKLFKWFPSKTLACSVSEYNRTINDLNFNSKKVFLWNNSIEPIVELNNNHKTPKKYICFIGRLSYQKNPQLLIKSFLELRKKMTDVHLMMVGIGHYSPDLYEIEEMIKNMGLADNITLIPWLNRTETLEILKKAEVYVSTSRYEGLPFALIEALALSKACVVTNVDGNKDLVQNEINGYCVDENPKEISKKIYSILSNEELRKKMEENSKVLFNQKYNIENNIPLLEKIYLEF